MRNHAAFTAVMVALLLPAFALAADAPTYGFECDTMAGHFSSWTRSVTTKEITVKGSIAVNEIRPDKKWVATASVLLRGDARHRDSYGIRLYVPSKEPDIVVVELLKIGGNSPIGAASIPRTKKALPFTLALTPTGTLKATLGDGAASVELGAFTPGKIVLGCSTGDFSFADVGIAEVPAGS
jgi:hypothetical protein